MTFVQTETVYLSKKEYEAFDLVLTCLQRMHDHSKNPDMPLITESLLDGFEDLFVHVCDDTMMEEHDEKNMNKYRLIDDPLCDINPNIDTYENCEDCPYFWECM